jgi:hypothetical protein
VSAASLTHAFLDREYRSLSRDGELAFPECMNVRGVVEIDVGP